MNSLIAKLLDEVDTDIKEIMLVHDAEHDYKNWQRLDNPVQEILMWQQLRDRKKLLTKID